MNTKTMASEDLCNRVWKGNAYITRQLGRQNGGIIMDLKNSKSKFRERDNNKHVRRFI